MDERDVYEKLSEGKIGKPAQDIKVISAITLESEVLAKASEGYGSLDEETPGVRYAAMHVTRIYMQLQG